MHLFFVLDNRWDAFNECGAIFIKWYLLFFFLFLFFKVICKQIFLLCFGRITINLTNFIYFEGLCVCLEGRKGEQECSWTFIRVAVSSCLKTCLWYNNSQWKIIWRFVIFFTFRFSSSKPKKSGSAFTYGSGHWRWHYWAVVSRSWRPEAGQLKPYCLSILFLVSYSELVQITICDFFKCHIKWFLPLLYQPIVLFSHMLTLKSKSSVELIAHVSKRTSFSSVFLKIDFFESLCHSLLSE